MNFRFRCVTNKVFVLREIPNKALILGKSTAERANFTISMLVSMLVGVLSCIRIARIAVNFLLELKIFRVTEKHSFENHFAIVVLHFDLFELTSLRQFVERNELASACGCVTNCEHLRVALRFFLLLFLLNIFDLIRVSHSGIKRSFLWRLS